jgi:hypothetical protein
MPFASKFRAMMGFPFAGETVGGYAVESVHVTDEHGDTGRYAYHARMVLRGSGGAEGVRQALKAMFAQHPMTFSGYGNPYQLWCGKPTIESLGEKRYEVTVDGAGARVYLEEELERLLGYLEERGLLAEEARGQSRGALLAAYLEGYKGEIKRQVDRYRGRLRREGTPGNM